MKRILARVSAKVHAIAKADAALEEVDLQDWVADAIERKLESKGKLPGREAEKK